MSQRKNKRRGRKIATAEAPWNGDHGTGTAAANIGTEVVPIKGSNPNRLARRQRINQIEKIKDKLSQRQFQAAQAIEVAYCRVQTLESGGPLAAKVDTSARPDANMANQVSARSHLVHVMKPVPKAMRDVVEHVCWHNRPISQLETGGRGRYKRMADLKVALDLVANHMKY